MSEGLEKKWIEEFEELNTLQFDNLSQYEREEKIYLAARRKAQVEIDKLILERDFFERENVDYRNEIVTIKPKLKSRDAEIERLKEKFKPLFILYGESLEKMPTVNEIQKRDELLEQAIVLLTQNTHKLSQEQWLKQYEEMKR